ncbi:hypothetical protein ACK36P_17730, partial [Aeromonas veronii]
VSHLVPSGSPFIGGKGVNHIQDGTQASKKPQRPPAAAFLSHPSQRLSFAAYQTTHHPLLMA